LVTENKTARLFSEENCLFDQDKKVKELLVKAGKKCTTTTNQKDIKPVPKKHSRLASWKNNKSNFFLNLLLRKNERDID
jgi:hypothetical protein